MGPEMTGRSGGIRRMRRALELLLLLSGALGLALGLDTWLKTGQPAWEICGGGAVALLAGLALSLRWSGTMARPAPAPNAAGPLGMATVAFKLGQAPSVISRDEALEVAVDGDGTVHLRLKDGKPAGKLICRTGAAYFNTLKQNERETAIKLIGPMPPLVRVELWDETGLKKSA